MKNRKYLVIYKKGNKLYHAIVPKLTEKIHITNEKFDTVTLGYKHKLYSFLLSSEKGFFDALKFLRNQGLTQMFIIKNKFAGSEQIKLSIFLLGNPFYDIVLDEKVTIEFDKENPPEGNAEETKSIIICDRSDWEYAEKEFDFKSDFVNNILD